MSIHLSAVDLLKKLIDEINKSDIILVPLRHKPINYDNAFQGDYDFLLPFDSLNSFLKHIFDLCSQENYNFTIVRSKYGKTQIILFDREDDKSIKLEIWHHLEVVDSSTVKYILWENIFEYIIKDDVGGYKLVEDVEACFYLSHLATKNKNLQSEEVKYRLKYYLNLTKNPTLIGYYQSIIYDNSQLKDIAHLSNLYLVQIGVLNLKNNPYSRIKDLIVRLSVGMNRSLASLYKLNKIYPVMGPDGVGKTTLIESLKNNSENRIRYYRFKKLFRRSIIYSLIYKIWYFQVKTDLKQDIEKNQIDDIYGGVIFCLALLRFPMLKLMGTFGKKHIFTDRFFYDFLFYGSRFQQLSMRMRKNWRMMLFFTPKTYWVIQLDAPEELILSRKQEMSIDHIRFYRQNMFNLYLDKPAYIFSYVNTSGSLTRCANNLVLVLSLIHKKRDA